MKQTITLALCLSILSCSKPYIIPINQNLHRGETSQALKFKLSHAGEVQVGLLAQSDTDWGEHGNESATLSIQCDGSELSSRQDLILYMGRRLHEYWFSWGLLPAGSYTCKFTFDNEKSRPNATKIFLEEMKLDIITKSNPKYDIYRYSPILYGRGIENTFSDTPLLMYYESQMADSGLNELKYTVIFSNEDGGTDTQGLLQNWGRTTDIEWIYSAFLDADGNYIKSTFQGRDHEVMNYSASFIDDHAMLNTCTMNNMVRQDTSSVLKFFMSPLYELPKGKTRETAMDANPYLYQVMIKEMAREGKYELPGDPFTLQASDYRNYVLIDIDFFQNGKGQKNLMPAVCLQQDTTVWYYADHNQHVKKGPSGRSPRRMTIELPPGTQLDDLVILKILDPALDEPGTFLEIMSIQQIAKLDKDFNLRIHPFSWNGPSLKIEQEYPREIRFDIRRHKLIAQIN